MPRPRSRTLPANFSGFLVTGQIVIRSFPWRQEIEVAELLRQAHRRIDDTFEFVVVTHLNKSGQRKILAQRIAVEPVVGEQPAHVRMAGEGDAVEVEDLALEPIRAGKHFNDGMN